MPSCLGPFHFSFYSHFLCGYLSQVLDRGIAGLGAWCSGPLLVSLGGDVSGLQHILSIPREAQGASLYFPLLRPWMGVLNGPPREALKIESQS